jgi:hypothetical protein
MSETVDRATTPAGFVEPIEVGAVDPTAEFRGSLNRTLRPTRLDRSPSPDRRKAFNELVLWRVRGIAEFSDDGSLGDGLALIRAFRAHPAAKALDEALAREMGSDFLGQPRAAAPARGRPREAGSWACLYLAFVLSRLPSLQAWVFGKRSDPIWEACGFRRPLSYQAVYEHFRLLEDCWEAFASAARTLIREAKLVEDRIGQIAVVDATHWFSPYQLEHCCRDAEACEAAGGWRLTPADDQTVKEARWSEAEEDETTDTATVTTDRTRLGVEVVAGRSYAVFRIKGHLFRTLDLDAGVRRYGDSKAWVGGLLQAAVDAFTGSPLAVEVFPADVQEYDAYPFLFDGLCNAIGTPPYIVSVDRLYSIRAFYEWNVRRGVAIVAKRKRRPNRQKHSDWRAESFDEDGIPRCGRCGGEGNQDAPGLGLTFTRSGEPVIRFVCRVPFDEGCHGVQQIYCQDEWAMLVPLSRRTDLYHSIRRVTHHNKENVYRIWRKRYTVAGKDGSSQLCRGGIGAQRLRANACLLLDWYRLSLRNGWISPEGLDIKVARLDVERLSAIQDRRTGAIIEPGVGTDWLEQRLETRVAQRLHLPYGERWETKKAQVLQTLRASEAFQNGQ